MAWDTNYIYGFTKFLTRHNQTGGIDSQDFFYAWNSEQSAMQSDLLGRFNLRSNGKSGMNTGLILNETIKQDLAAFTLPLPITIASGKATKPSGFIYEVGLRKGGYDIIKINHGQIASVTNSVIDPPSVVDNKIYTVEYEGYYYLLPQSVTGTVDLDYIAACRDIVWAYTFDSLDNKIYNESGLTRVPVIFGGVGYTTPTIAFSAPGVGGVQATGTLTVSGGIITAVVMTNVGQGYAGLTPTFTITGASTTPAILGTPVVSVQPQWSQNVIIEITRRTLKTYGISFKDKDMEQYANSVINTGD